MFFHKREENNNCVFATIGLAKPDPGKLFTYLTGPLPVTSNRGMQIMVILYAYDTTEILVEPIKTRSDADMLHAYSVLHDTLENVVHAPRLNIMDNNKLLQTKETVVQLLPPHNHRRNSAEHIIRTFKNNFVALLASVDNHFTICSWCRIVRQE